MLFSQRSFYLLCTALHFTTVHGASQQFSVFSDYFQILVLLSFHFQTERFLSLRITKSLTSTRLVFIILRSYTPWWIIHILLIEGNMQSKKLFFKVSLSQCSIDTYHLPLMIALSFELWRYGIMIHVWLFLPFFLREKQLWLSNDNISQLPSSAVESEAK